MGETLSDKEEYKVCWYDSIMECWFVLGRYCDLKSAMEALDELKQEDKKNSEAGKYLITKITTKEEIVYGND